MEYSALFNLTEMSGLLDKSMDDIRCSMFLSGVLVTLIVQQHLDSSFDISSDWLAKVTKETL
jgi:hypothetical protein